MGENSKSDVSYKSDEYLCWYYGHKNIFMAIPGSRKERSGGNIR